MTTVYFVIILMLIFTVAGEVLSRHLEEETGAGLGFWPRLALAAGGGLLALALLYGDRLLGEAAR